MNEQIHFTMPLAAIGWQRARKNGNTFFDDEKTAQMKKRIRGEARLAMSRRGVFTAPFKVSIVARYKPPASWPKWKSGFYAAHHLPKTSTPDLDNIAKLICDACNGVIWKDDAQIAHIDVDKTWGAEDCLSVWAYPMRPIPRTLKEVRI